MTLVHIEANNQDDAYTIFETMNDRGLSLSPTDMLKGYLLANIKDDNQKLKANDLWKKRILELVEFDKVEEIDFFKHWFRAKYAETLRERSKGKENKDFEKVATSFHKWVRDNKKNLQLNTSNDYYEFITKHFDFYAKQYGRILDAAWDYTEGLEYLYYNAHNNFTHQYHLLLSPLKVTDSEEIVDCKMNMVAYFIDMWVVNRFISYSTLNYSAISYTMYNLTKEIRNKDLNELTDILKKQLKSSNIDAIKDFKMHQQNKKYVHYLLARLTHHIEVESGIDSKFETYVTKESKNPFQIEHIWAKKYERYSELFDHESEFTEYRNRVGGLLLLPKRINQSYGDAEYQVKLKQYFGQNLLAKSLHKDCYESNPSFNRYRREKNLPFRPHNDFSKEDLDERQKLYANLAKDIWNLDKLDVLKTN
ncbi:DUF262 domain-containing protein [Domibacillus aminovorans]|uniref:DUF262 domain-containing protein n=1 Tax=Domibacillus aminovorans TaxID=29332 RepID=UPI000AEA58C4|nr:DUF1524 domain-containing protein [Domibacillus aminovorans]